MNNTTQYDQKLASLSKTMLVFFRTWFLLIAALTILPWTLPANKLCAFLLTVFPQISALSNSYDTIFSSISITARLLGLIGMVLGLFPMLAGSLIMLRLTKNYIRKEVFSLKNATSYTQLGIVFLLSALLLGPLSDAFISLAATINNPVGHRTISIGFGSPNLTEIFFSIIFIILGRVMRLGHKISEEQALTV